MRYALLLLTLAATPSSAAKIMVFGGNNHETYLGCLSCAHYSLESVRNPAGKYGGAWSMNSLMNPASKFAGTWSQYSACNEFASDPPVIVDEEGQYYGRLTLNGFKDQTNSAEIVRWLQMVCSGELQN